MRLRIMTINVQNDDGEPPQADRFGGTSVATRWPHRIREVRQERTAGVHWWIRRWHRKALPTVTAEDLNAGPEAASIRSGGSTYVFVESTGVVVDLDVSPRS